MRVLPFRRPVPVALRIQTKAVKDLGGFFPDPLMEASFQNVVQNPVWVHGWSAGCGHSGEQDLGLLWAASAEDLHSLPTLLLSSSS